MFNYQKIARFFIYLVPFSVVIVSTETLFPFIVAKYTWFRISVLASLIFFLLELLFGKMAQIYEKRLFNVLKSPLAIATLIFTAAFVTAGFLGIDPKMSFWSNFERGEGGFQIITLFIFFILLQTLLREKKEWHALFISSIIAALSMIVYGVLASLKYAGYIGIAFNEPGYRFQGSIGNPAYVATYLLFAIVYVLYLLAEKYNFNIKSFGSKFLILISLILFTFFILAATRGAFVGLGIGVLAGLSYLAFSKNTWRKRLIALALTFIIIIGGAVAYLNLGNKAELIEQIPALRIFDLSFYATTFQHRMIMWGIAWNGMKERPLFGWGPENYLQIFDRYYNPAYYNPIQNGNYGAWFDRAHSVIFDYLAEIGIIGFLSYVSIFVVFYIMFFKRNDKLRKDKTHLIKNVLILITPLMYLIQGLVLFDILPTYINVFLFLAFANAIFLSSESIIASKTNHIKNNA